VTQDPEGRYRCYDPRHLPRREGRAGEANDDHFRPKYGNSLVVNDLGGSMDGTGGSSEAAQSVVSEIKAMGGEAIANGGMVEVPAAAICAVSFAKRLDFLSIGTNDLIQYTLAIDRADREVAHLYNPIHPAVLRLVRDVIQSCVKRNMPVSVCGEMAGDPKLTRLLLGFGLREFSMHPSQVLLVKQELLRSRVTDCVKQSSKIIKQGDPSRLALALQKWNQDCDQSSG
jgi:phosphotransferase system enzyme I (PtsI)